MGFLMESDSSREEALYVVEAYLKNVCNSLLPTTVYFNNCSCVSPWNANYFISMHFALRPRNNLVGIEFIGS